jgi:hypothetical protein
MRMLMTVQMEIDAGNRAIKDGTLAKLMDSTVERFRPESVYFATRAGERIIYIVFDLDEEVKMIAIAEPFFSGLNAKVDMTPAMTLDDVRHGLSRLSDA